MGFFDSKQKRRVSLTGRESMATLDHMADFFEGGANWTQHAYNRSNGTKCLVGAANHVRVSSVDDAKYWLRQAIAEQGGGAGFMAIEGFNDTRGSYGEIEAVLARAKQLAASANRVSAPAAVAALPAPARLAALPAPAAQIPPARTLAYEPQARMPDAMPRAVRQPVAAPASPRAKLAEWFKND